MVVRAILEHARRRGWIDDNPAATVERQPVRYSGDYDFFSREELDSLDPVFVGRAGGHIDASALRRRYMAALKHAGLRPLPFHSLRHYFGSMAVNRASLVQVQSWMGHAHIQTTARYLHAKSQADGAALLAAAFAPSTPEPITNAPARP